MRIGIIVPPWLPIPPRGYGGLEVVVNNLARGLDATGHDVMLCCTGDSTCSVPRFSPLPEAVGMPGGVGVKYEMYHTIESYRFLEREWGADIVHDHTLTGPWASASHDLPVVTTNHMPFDREFNCYYSTLTDTIPIIAISMHQASQTTLPITAIIHNGTDVYDVERGGGEGGYALWIGRFDEEKGADVAIRVARDVGIPLKMVAPPPSLKQRDFFVNHVKSELDGKQVEWVGQVTDQETKSQLLGNTVCLLNPISWDEPFGMVMIEALAHGTPVVATRRGSVPELITNTETGYVCEDELDLRVAVRLCMEGEHINRDVCRKVAIDRFSTQQMVQEHLKMYENVVNDVWR